MNNKTNKQITITTVIVATIALAFLSVPNTLVQGEWFTAEKLPEWKVLLTAFALESVRAVLLILSVGLSQNGRRTEYFIFGGLSLGLSVAIGFYLHKLLCGGGDTSTAFGAQVVNGGLFLLEVFLGRLILTGEGGIVKLREDYIKNIEDYNSLADRKDEADLELEEVKKELEGVKIELDEVRPKLESVKNVLERNRVLIEDNKSSIGGYAPLVCEHDGTIIQVFSNNTPKATCPTCSRTVVKKSKIVSLSKAANS